MEQVSLAAIRLLESYQVRQGPHQPMLESLEGLTRLGGIPQVLLYSQDLARFQGSHDLLLPVLPNLQISPREGTPSLPRLPPQSPVCPRGLQGGMVADLALRRNQGDTFFSMPGLGRLLVLSLRSPIIGLGEAPGLRSGSGWWWPEWKIPHWLGYTNVWQAWSWPFA